MPNSRNSRNFTQNEISIATGVVYQDITTEVLENMFWLTMEERPGVQVFAISQNEYLVHQETASEIYITDDIKDALDAAAEILATS